MKNRYINPTTVKSPKYRTKSKVEVIYNGGCGGYALSFMFWDDEYVIGIRWNGGSDKVSSTPTSRVPVWFILPHEIGSLYIRELNVENNKNNHRLLDIKDPKMSDEFEKYLEKYCK